MKTLLSGTASEVWIAEEHPTVLIGERINLAGKKRLCEALLNGDMAPIIREAVSQVAAGADALDVNVSVAGADEVVLLTKVVETLQPSVRVPLCLDSANPAALEAALRVCHGKPLINSVTGAEDSLAVVLP
ncbi:MAG: dihydropteroate synthase, partial [Chloroflexi bacterium]|nr:dihydropteroate synthase [Chloroflexota bacterium]